MCFGGGSSEPRVIKRQQTQFKTIATETPDVTQRIMESGSSANPNDFGTTLGSYSNPANLGPGPFSKKGR
jgi:hypothetical protein